MSTDYQQAREDLGIRLRELRLTAPEGRLTGTQLATRLGAGWSKVKVSKLENGRQTATSEDLRAWAQGTGQPETYDELLARLRGFESHIRSWRRQLSAGHKTVQDAAAAEGERTEVLTIWENCLIPACSRSRTTPATSSPATHNSCAPPATPRTRYAPGSSARRACTSEAGSIGS